MPWRYLVRGRLDPVEVPQQLRDRRPRLETSEKLTEASVDARAEQDALLRRPAKIHAGGILERRWVAVGGDPPQRQALPGGDRSAADLDVARCRAVVRDQWTVAPQDLVDGVIDQDGLLAQALLEPRVAGEVRDHDAERPGHGAMAGGPGAQRRDDALVAQRLSVDRGVDEPVSPRRRTAWRPMPTRPFGTIIRRPPSGSTA